MTVLSWLNRHDWTVMTVHCCMLRVSSHHPQLSIKSLSVHLAAGGNCLTKSWTCIVSFIEDIPAPFDLASDALLRWINTTFNRITQVAWRNSVRAMITYTHIELEPTATRAGPRGQVPAGSATLNWMFYNNIDAAVTINFRAYVNNDPCHTLHLRCRFCAIFISFGKRIMFITEVLPYLQPKNQRKYQLHLEWRLKQWWRI